MWKAAHAQLYPNEMDLFVETKQAQTFDKRHTQSVTQIGKSVFSKRMHAPTEADKLKHTKDLLAKLSPLESNNTPAI